MVQYKRSARRKFPPRDVKKTHVSFVSLRQRNLVRRAFSQKGIEQVRKYLMHLGADTTWQQIAKGDIVGYTLMAHEHAEMEYFRRKGLDPFNHQDFVAYYEEAHAEALVEEHKIHQWLAYNALGYDLNIATLVARNSIVDEQTRTDDLLLLQRYTPHKAVRAADVSKADEYYAKLKEGVIG